MLALPIDFLERLHERRHDEDLGAAVDSTDCNAIAHSVGKLFRGKGGEGHFRRVLVGSHSDVEFGL